MALMGGEETVRADVQSRGHIKVKSLLETGAEKEKGGLPTKESRKNMATYKRSGTTKASVAGGRGLTDSRKPWCTSELQEEMTQEIIAVLRAGRKISQSLLERLRTLASRLEGRIRDMATTKEEYANKETLKARLQEIQQSRTINLIKAPVATVAKNSSFILDEALSMSLFERLLRWRVGVLERDSKLLPWDVCSNAHLASIARCTPITLGDLQSMDKLAPKQFEDYGEMILAVTVGFLKEENLLEKVKQERLKAKMSHLVQNGGPPGSDTLDQRAVNLISPVGDAVKSCSREGNRKASELQGSLSATAQSSANTLKVAQIPSQTDRAPGKGKNNSIIKRKSVGRERGVGSKDQSKTQPNAKRKNAATTNHNATSPAASTSARFMAAPIVGQSFVSLAESSLGTAPHASASISVTEKAPHIPSASTNPHGWPSPPAKSLPTTSLAQPLMTTGAPLLTKQHQIKNTSSRSVGQAAPVRNDSSYVEEPNLHIEFLRLHSELQNKLAARQALDSQINSLHSQLESLGRMAGLQNDALSVLKGTQPTLNCGLKWSKKRKATMTIEGRKAKGSRSDGSRPKRSQTTKATSVSKKKNPNVGSVGRKFSKKAPKAEDRSSEIFV